MSEVALFNGEPGEPALAFHRGFTYGDGVFRTCLIHDSRVVDLDRQLAKLRDDAAALDIDDPGASLALEARELARGARTGCCAATRRRRFPRATGSRACARGAPISGWPRSPRWPGSST